ncbi:hypothetical protein NXC14_PC00821 (plasmid) [Rhizobium sp. NXC14]|uniref:GlcG/HbpS family heme-binding protein n=1 Tax=Rhizobium sp. NXC14 TaxID=1981173 RepID=UPI000A2091CE|nr:heme-binding protein [Rhizobium sp. NXC14]ARO34353.1 hypothetical protein NXC14_PC00821 [Rhizobium sp. NXC14]
MASTIDLAAARDMIAVAEVRAAKIGVRASIVVLDHGGDFVAMARMDGAWAGAFDLAIGKARTSRAFQAPSSAFVPLICQSASKIHPLSASNFDPLGGVDQHLACPALAGVAEGRPSAGDDRLRL